MGQWLPDSVESVYNDTVAAAGDQLGGSTDEAAGRWVDQATQINDAYNDGELSYAQGMTGLFRITTRHGLGPIGPQVEDFAFENAAGEFMGQEDDTDLFGPELGGSSEPGEGGWSIDWRNPDAEDEDPTHPDNWAPEWLQWLLGKPKVLLTVGAAVVALLLLRPLLTLLAGLTGGA
jgi:hypothetical protein